MIEEAKKIMCDLYEKYGLCDASLRASQLVDELLNIEGVIK